MQCVIAIVGMGLNSYELRNTHRDYRYAMDYGVRAQKTIVAWNHMERESINLICQGLLLLAGVISLYLPPPPPLPQLNHMAGIQIAIHRMALATVSILLVVKSLAAHRERYILNSMLDAKRKDDPR